ncbi:hypothetical protein EW145_g1038 [Phellinidium pouzarii]|uniref:Type 1 phosphatases regulator n=1 Tax=Phellinidium pouzarii TaxID=167371 RepID=A0A4S4LGP2_9AGAM|nr:hypothetical protein EW145_g1038 [Phellinidium pouzarii]
MSFVATRPSSSTAAPSGGSRTMILHDSQPREEGIPDAAGNEHASGDDAGRVQSVLRLRGGPRATPRVAWTEDVVDNEGMGKKKSKSAFCAPSPSVPPACG